MLKLNFLLNLKSISQKIVSSRLPVRLSVVVAQKNFKNIFNPLFLILDAF